MTIYILGAGPTGLAVGDGLTDLHNHGFKIFESQQQVGGLATTIEWSGIGHHDLGPHKLFTSNDLLFARIKLLLPEFLWLKKNKVSSIYLRGQFLNYPPNLISLLKVYGLIKFLKMSGSFLKIKIKRNKVINNFEEDLVNRVGRSIYNILFFPIAKKLWGEPSTLSIKLSKGRIQTPPVLELVLATLGLRRKSSFEALDFFYPKGGLVKIWDAIHKKIGKEKIYLSSKVVNITLMNNRITSFDVIHNNVKKTYLLEIEDYLISTLPILKTYESLSSSLKHDYLGEAKNSIKFNDLYLIFLHVDHSKLFKESWIFVPDPEISFHRVSEQSSFDPEMVKKGSIICVEIMMTEGRFKKEMIESELIELCIKDLKKVVPKQFKVLQSKVIKLFESYPVFLTGHEVVLEKILKQLDSIENFKSIGRQGSFNYIGTLDAMDIGYGLAAWISNFEKTPWENERSRTSEYPILD